MPKWLDNISNGIYNTKRYKKFILNIKESWTEILSIMKPYLDENGNVEKNIEDNYIDEIAKLYTKWKDTDLDAKLEGIDKNLIKLEYQYKKRSYILQEMENKKTI